MAKRPRHFYEAMGKEKTPQQPARSGERGAEPLPPVPPPVQVVPVQNTITIRKETFIAGIIFFVVIIIVAFLVGRSTAPTTPEKGAKEEVAALKPTLLEGENFAILAATFPLSRLKEAEDVREQLVKIGWTNAKIQKDGKTAFLLLTPYRTKEKAEQALEAIKETTYKGKKIFKGARLLER